MKELSVDLTNCYGIKSLKYVFDFGVEANRRKSFAVYAPNGLMKTSLTKTFDRLAQGAQPLEERFRRTAQAIVLVDGVPISSDAIYVLKSELDVLQESPEISNILVSPDKKGRYDALILNIEKHKIKAIASLQKLSGVPKNDIELTLIADAGKQDFAACIEALSNASTNCESLPYKYCTIFDQRVIDLLKNPAFLDDAKEFSERYQEIFTQEGTIFKKDVFNPISAERSFDTLKSQGYFDGGHRLFLNGDSSPVGLAELENRVKAILSKIESDQRLKKVKQSIAKNAQTQAIASLFESLSISEIETLLNGLKPENQKAFKVLMWQTYVNACSESKTYLGMYQDAKAELYQIEQEAADLAPEWSSAVDLFNSRFTEMPFKLEVENKSNAALGKEKAKLAYVFKDDGEEVRLHRNELLTLSQGEKRALYLLNFIFEIEARAKLEQEMLFIIDDPADSFDYKNKHAIIQYLEDVDKRSNIYQIILTHNYDFFRSTTSFVNRSKCLMANKHPEKIDLQRADGVENYFRGVLKPKFKKCMRALCATIPFTRNIIEYTKDEYAKNSCYLKLTSMLHQKADTDTISLQEYVNIYNDVFNVDHPGSDKLLLDIIYEEADKLSGSEVQTGLNLEDKVLLSIAIRLKAEDHMLKALRVAMNQPNYWCDGSSQFGALLGLYEKYLPKSQNLAALRRVSVTVSSNIHINSFMYEPILDLSLGHLSELYKDVSSLEVA